MATTIEELLSKLDLGKFADKFKAEDIDLSAAKALSEDDMKDLGLTLGARKKLYQALHPAGPGSTGSPGPAAPISKPAPPAGPKVVTDVNALGWKWMHGGTYWAGNAGGLTGGAGIVVRLEDGDDPSYCYSYRTGYGNINDPVNIWDIESGQVTHKLKNTVQASICGTQMDNLLAQVGDSLAYAVWNVADGKVLTSGKTPNGEGLMFCSLVKSASGAAQLAAINYHASQCFVWDVESGNLAGKFKLLDNTYAKNMLRDPTNPATVLIVTDGKTHIVDLRAKSVQRALVSVFEGSDMKFARNSGGKIISHSRDFATVVDYATGKLMHKILPPEERGAFHAVAMYGNCVSAFVEVPQNTGYHFWDLNGAAAEITESQHDLKYSNHYGSTMDMSKKYVVGFGSAAYSFKNGK